MKPNPTLVKRQFVHDEFKVRNLASSIDLDIQSRFDNSVQLSNDEILFYFINPLDNDINSMTDFKYFLVFNLKEIVIKVYQTQFTHCSFLLMLKGNGGISFIKEDTYLAKNIFDLVYRRMDYLSEMFYEIWG